LEKKKIVKPYCVTSTIQLAVILATGIIPMAVLLKASQALNYKGAPFIVLPGIEEHNLMNLLYAS
jgi:hypothetical protein